MENFDKFIQCVKIGDIENAKSNFDIEYLNKEDEYGMKPIHWACVNYQIDILKWMLQNKCDIETRSKDGWRPIHYAALIHDQKMVKLLIESYCEFDCKTNNGETVLDVVNFDYSHEFINKLLRENKNRRIGLSMGLKCGLDCDHEFCLTSVIRCNFSKSQRIGSGSFSKVYKVKDSQCNLKFAIKIIKDLREEPGISNIMSNINQYIPKINHSKIIKYYGRIEIPKEELIIFMECMDCGSVKEEIKRNGPLPHLEIARYCKDILQAVAFLHDNKIIHRDIKPSNIFIDGNGGCKLAISSYSRSLAVDGDDEGVEMVTTFCGTAHYMAPEIIDDEQYSYPVDIWSLGVSLVHMLTGHPPYHNLVAQAVLFKIAATKKLEFTPPHPMPKEIQKFLDVMTKANPTQRATADELLEYEFIRNVPIDCEIDNEVINMDSIIDYSDINRKNCTDLIENAIKNKQVALAMGLKCQDDCDHKFCLSSVTATSFKKGKEIGEGGFGKVYKMKESKSNRELAMKVIKKPIDENFDKEAKYFEYDINRYRDDIEHKNIVKYFGAISNSKEIFIFMELIDGESLKRKISKNQYKSLPDETIKKYTRQILEGLKFLHNSSPQIIHRDIKSENILVNKKGDIKIADFGFSRFLRTITMHKNKTNCGTANYMSPEVINDEAYDCSADIWSAGATVFEMASGRCPYYEMSETSVIVKIATTKKLNFASILSDEMKKFIKLMTNPDPKKRPDAELLLCSNFLK